MANLKDVASLAGVSISTTNSIFMGDADDSKRSESRQSCKSEPNRLPPARDAAFADIPRSSGSAFLRVTQVPCAESRPLSAPQE